jgi:hypothetical protein
MNVTCVCCNILDHLVARPHNHDVVYLAKKCLTNHGVFAVAYPYHHRGYLRARPKSARYNIFSWFFYFYTKIKCNGILFNLYLAKHLIDDNRGDIYTYAMGVELFLLAQRRFLAFSMNETLKLSVVCGSLRPGFLILLRRSRFVGKEIKILI